MQNERLRAIAASLALSMAGSIAFAAAFWMHASTQALGASIAAAFIGLALACLGWSRWILPQEQVVDLRDTVPGPQEDRVGQVEAAVRGTAETTRRTWLTRMLLAACGTLGLAALFPLGSLGPPPGDSNMHSRWRRGSRLKRVDGTIVRAEDLNVGSVVTVYPEDAVGDYNSMAVLIRLPDGVGKGTVDGMIAFSKACTHAGCPVALYRAADCKLVCPCHQSAFDVTDGARVVDGPADRPLPQLPIALAPGGYVEAGGDFNAPIGPGFWQLS